MHWHPMVTPEYQHRHWHLTQWHHSYWQWLDVLTVSVKYGAVRTGPQNNLRRRNRIVVRAMPSRARDPRERNPLAASHFRAGSPPREGPLSLASSPLNSVLGDTVARNVYCGGCVEEKAALRVRQTCTPPYES